MSELVHNSESRFGRRIMKMRIDFVWGQLLISFIAIFAAAQKSTSQIHQGALEYELKKPAKSEDAWTPLVRHIFVSLLHGVAEIVVVI